MIMDYHIHTKASPDAVGDMEDYIKEASKKRIDEIGFSEHITLHHGKNDPYRPSDFMETYVQRFIEIKEKSEMPIKLGAETDFFPNEVSKIGEFVKKYPFDYVIGAIHYIGSWALDSRSQMQEYLKRDMSQVYENYFKIVTELCKSHLFNTLAHPDIVKVFGFKPNCDISNLLDETAEAIAESGICIEVNTSGLVRPCAEIYPGKQFLKILHDHRVPITLGSDAHKPQDVGRSFDKAIKLVKEVGYTHACTFESRKRKMEKI